MRNLKGYGPLFGRSRVRDSDNLSRATNMSLPIERVRKWDLSLVVCYYVSLFQTHGWLAPAVARGGQSAGRLEHSRATPPRTILASLPQGPCRQPLPKDAPQREPREALNLSAAAWRILSSVGGSNRQQKSRSGTDADAPCEDISDVISPRVHLEVPHGWVSLRIQEAAKTPAQRRFSTDLRRAWWIRGVSSLRLPAYL